MPGHKIVDHLLKLQGDGSAGERTSSRRDDAAALKRIGRNCQRYFWFSAYHATAAMKATTASTAKKILRTL